MSSSIAPAAGASSVRLPCDCADHRLSRNRTRGVVAECDALFELDLRFISLCHQQAKIVASLELAHRYSVMLAHRGSERLDHVAPRDVLVTCSGPSISATSFTRRDVFNVLTIKIETRHHTNEDSKCHTTTPRSRLQRSTLDQYHFHVSVSQAQQCFEHVGWSPSKHLPNCVHEPKTDCYNSGTSQEDYSC